MKFTFPDHFLDLAERLSKENDEAAQRTSVSRAYYAAFHGAQTHCRAKKLLTGLRTTHRDVWENFDPSRPVQSVSFIGWRRSRGNF